MNTIKFMTWLQKMAEEELDEMNFWKKHEPANPAKFHDFLPMEIQDFFSQLVEADDPSDEDLVDRLISILEG